MYGLNYVTQKEPAVIVAAILAVVMAWRGGWSVDLIETALLLVGGLFVRQNVYAKGNVVEVYDED
jgi:hypothetical protein